MKSYKLTIVLKDTLPMVERTISVPKDISFRDLHYILLESMGWEDEYHYEFVAGPDGALIGPKMPYSDVRNIKNDVKTMLSDYYGCDLLYTYGSGRGWVHEIRFIGETDFERPVVMEHSGRCPPEQCRGAEEFQSYLDIIEDPSNESYPEVKRWFDERYLELDVDSVNEYFDKEWERFDLGIVITSEQFDAIVESVMSVDDCDLLFDTRTKTAVRSDQVDVPDECLIPLISKGDSITNTLMDRFLALPVNRVLYRKVGMVRNNTIKYRRFKTILSKDQKSSQRWDSFLSNSYQDIIFSWAVDNGYEVEPPQMSEEEIEGVLKGFMKSFSTLCDESSMMSEKYLCPKCGTLSVATINYEGNPSSLKGVDCYPAVLSCKKCRTKTSMEKLNDGFYIGYHYKGWVHPYGIVESVLKRFFDLKDIQDRYERFIACSVLQLSLLRLEMFDQGQECQHMMKELMDPMDPLQVSIMEVVDSIFDNRPPSTSVLEHTDRMPLPVALKALSNLESTYESLSDVEDAHRLAVSMFDSWEDRDEDYFVLRMFELVVYTHDERPVDASQEMISLLKEAISWAIEHPKKTNPIHMVIASIFERFSMRLWELGFNDELKELCTIMGSYVESGEPIPMSFHTIYNFRMGLLELTLGDGIDSAEPYLKKVIEMHLMNEESGPLTVTRSLPSVAILTRYGRLEKKFFESMLNILYMASNVRYVSKEGFERFASYVVYALMHDRPFADAYETLSNAVQHPVMLDESDVIDDWENPMSLWGLEIVLIP